MENKTKPLPVELETGEVVAPKLDLKQFIGKPATIVSTDIFEGEYGYYVKIMTNSVHNYKRGTETKEICASRMFGLQQDDKTGKYGWDKDSELAGFLAGKKCKSLEELKGKKVIIQVTTKDRKDFLSFT